MVYRDLPEFGLRFVRPDDEKFGSLVTDIRARAFGWPVEVDLEEAAVLLNQSGKAVIALAAMWKFTDASGSTSRHRIVNLGSSAQIDALMGRAEVTRDRFNFILPGSKRLITQQGILGDNSDVLPPEPPRGGRIGFSGSGSGGRGRRSGDEHQKVELALDTVFFDDGLCVGPDEAGLFESVRSELDVQRRVAGEISAAMRAGAPAGEVFERLRPLARHTGRPPHLLTNFASTAIHMLIQRSDEEVLAWLESAAAPARIRLRRPGEGGS